ncbi:hypothetical protein NQ318_001668 [Aromia moschata]|uniref:Mos1 transposase HTH domain-containing protein n=1 Tax=Aromia moschata TaxID=1265417 RepID=A0AAV8XIJ1_9CUCU|nr:hypothetical protein NQ318_001668 [Aromia moschata]
MQRSLEQRMAIKFCVKLEKSAAETIPMLKKAFGVDCLSDRQILRWHKAFAEGREDVNDENRAGGPSTSSSDDNVKCVRDLLNTDRRLSVRLISETLDITKTIVHEIVSGSLGMRKMSPICVLFELETSSGFNTPVAYKHIGFRGLHFPLTHLAVLFSGMFRPYPFPHAIFTMVPPLKDTLGSFPCFTTSTLTKGSLDSGSQGPLFLCFGFFISPSSFSGFSSSMLFLNFLLVLRRFKLELELLWLAPSALLPLPPFSALFRRILLCPSSISMNLLRIRSYERLLAGSGSAVDETKLMRSDIVLKLCECFTYYEQSSSHFSNVLTSYKQHKSFTKYISNGDSKTFKAILDLDPYNNDPKVMKKECVGHVEKNAWEPGSMNSVVENSYLHETCPPKRAALKQGSTAAILIKKINKQINRKSRKAPLNSITYYQARMAQGLYCACPALDSLAFTADLHYENCASNLRGEVNNVRYHAKDEATDDCGRSVAIFLIGALKSDTASDSHPNLPWEPCLNTDVCRVQCRCELSGVAI